MGELRGNRAVGRGTAARSGPGTRARVRVVSLVANKRESVEGISLLHPFVAFCFLQLAASVAKLVLVLGGGQACQRVFLGAIWCSLRETEESFLLRCIEA